MTLSTAGYVAQPTGYVRFVGLRLHCQRAGPHLLSVWAVVTFRENCQLPPSIGNRLHIMGWAHRLDHTGAAAQKLILWERVDRGWSSVRRSSARRIVLVMIISAWAAAAAGCGLIGSNVAEPEVGEPAPEAIPVSQADDLWQKVVTAAAGVSPVLIPAYLPAGLTEVRVRYVDYGIFSVEYFGQDCCLIVSAGPTSLPLEGEQFDVIIHDQEAVLQLNVADDPKAGLHVFWREPGRWVPDQTAPEQSADSIFYVVFARGLDSEEVLRFAEELTAR